MQSLRRRLRRDVRGFLGSVQPLRSRRMRTHLRTERVQLVELWSRRVCSDDDDDQFGAGLHQHGARPIAAGVLIERESSERGAFAP